MGVPGLFLWLNKKYDSFILNLDDSIKFKWLCLDANCLLHPKCYEVLNENKDFKSLKELEEKMINRCIEYISELVRKTDPSEGVYIAVDGVAPMGKIKQQRQRRFKSLLDDKMRDSIKRKYNKEIEKKWSNSALTPGTEFMSRITSKIIGWCRVQKRRIIFSSAHSEGEGEHKILNFIRERGRDNLGGNYLVYGLDADLIYLSMASQRGDIYLLRENNKMGGDSSILNVIDIESMKRGIIREMDSNLNDRERINDFIFLGYFLGNDFLPHFVSLDIYNNGMDILLEKYKECNMELKESIVMLEEGVRINKRMLVRLLEKLVEIEESLIKSNINKRGKRLKSVEGYEREMERIEKLLFRIDDPIMLCEGDYSEYSERYYRYYIKDYDETTRLKVCYEYIKGLVWNTEYYFVDCCSWEYYYKYDCAPFLSDLLKILKLIELEKIVFKKGEILNPLMQLMIVLPLGSGYLLPDKLNNGRKEISDLYPNRVEQDFLYKHFHWQGVPLLPDIDVERVRGVYNKFESKLDIKERKRDVRKKEFYFNI